MEFSRQEDQSGLPFPSPGESSWLRDWTQASSTAGRFFTVWATREAQNSDAPWALDHSSSDSLPAQPYPSQGFRCVCPVPSSRLELTRRQGAHSFIQVFIKHLIGRGQPCSRRQVQSRTPLLWSLLTRGRANRHMYICGQGLHWWPSG